MPPLPERITPTLAAIQARRQARAWSSRGNTFIPIGDAGEECNRALWYSFRWASPSETLSARKLRLFETGSIEERRMLDDLEQVEGVRVLRHDPETGKQWRIEIGDVVAGKMDAVALGLPEAPKAWHVVECKTANDKTFAAIKSKGVQKGQPSHWLQMQLYMLGEDIKRALYMLVNKNTDEEYVERVRFSPEEASRALARLQFVASSPRPPGKFREDAAKPPCSWCRHRGICHDGAFARAHCRTCLHATPGPAGIWRCERWGTELTPEQQAEGCPAHLYVPDLVPAEQIDADETAGTVTYRMPSGDMWVDGAGRPEARPA